jgi:arylsulfatase A-like enzyme
VIGINPFGRCEHHHHGHGGLTRRNLLQAGGTGALALGAAACGTDPFKATATHDKDAPNVLLIITDSTRADYISCYNASGKGHTPNIDALAKESLRFTHSVPDAMPTGCSRRDMLSGVRGFPFRYWHPELHLPPQPGWNSIPDDLPMLPEVAGAAGVTTGYSTDNPFLTGDAWAGFRQRVDHIHLSFAQALYRGFNRPLTIKAPLDEVERYVLPELSNSTEVDRLRQYVGWNSLYRHRESQYAFARVASGGMNLLEQFKDAQPWFLGVDIFDPHEPWDPPPAYRRRFGSEKKGIEKTLGITPIDPMETPSSRVSHLGISNDTVDLVRELYAAELTAVDAWIGRLLNKLDDLGMADNTVVYYTSDHGVSLGERDIMGKSNRDLHREIYHVPTMIRDPERRRAGDTSDFFVTHHDIARTLLSYQGIVAPGAMTGEDLTVFFEGGEPPPRPHYVACYADTLLCGDLEWMLLSDSDFNSPKLFHKAVDPFELDDVIDKYPEQYQRLKAVLEDEAGGTLPRFGDFGVIGG